MNETKISPSTSGKETLKEDYSKRDLSFHGSKLNREFNGKIQTYSHLDTYSGHRALKHLEKPINHYLTKLNSFIRDKTVHVIPYYWRRGCWSEYPLVNWILNNYKLLGYEKVVLEKTPEYYSLKNELGFNKFPDLLVYFDNKWHRLEVECWGHKYQYCHGHGYADLVIAYDNYYPRYQPDVPITTIKEWFGTTEIISSGEIPEFLYVYDREFNQDYSKAVYIELYGKMLPRVF